MAGFTVTASDRGSVAVLRLAGYFNDSGGKELQRVAEGLLRGGKPGLVIDFSGCTGINSLGVGELLGLLEVVAEEFQGKVALCGFDDVTRTVFHLSGILDMTPHAATVEDACRAVEP